MLFLVGVGLGDASDITVKGLEIVKKADKVYLEAYTSILCGDNSKQHMEDLYGRQVILADREFVESDSNQLLNEAANENIVLLVVGDPFGATTHSDIVLRAKTQGIPFKVVHNSSIMTAVGCCGLQLYSFGETVSIPFWDDSWKPSSFVDKIINNLRSGLHTLCLLDIKVKEQSVEALMKGKKEYDPPRFMSVSVAAKQLIAVVEKLKLEGDTESKELLNESSPVVGLARIGSASQEIVYCSLKEMQDVDLGQPLHSLVIPGKMHPLENEMLNFFKNSE